MSKKHKENLKENREPSGIFSLLITVIADVFKKIARSDHKSKKKEDLNSMGVPGSSYEMGCSSVASEKIASSLDRGGNYPSNDPGS